MDLKHSGIKVMKPQTYVALFKKAYEGLSLVSYKS